MSSTNKTTHYDLSQFTANDIPAWLADYNSDMGKIDTGIYNAQTAGGEASTKADNALTSANEAKTAVESLSTTVTNLQSTVTKNTEDISGVQTSLTSLTSQVSANGEAIQSIISQDFQIQIANTNSKLNQDKINVTISNFVNDSTFAKFKFRASLNWSGATTNFIPTGSLSPNSEYGGAILLQTTNDLLYVYTETDPSSLVFDWLSIRLNNVM